MNSKKIVSCALVTLMCFAFGISTFADGAPVYSASYSAGKVNHKFTTSNSIVKSSSETWTQIRDVISYSKYCSKSTDSVVVEVGSHTTYLVNGTGTRLSGGKSKTGAATISFSGTELNDANNAPLVKLLIYNPEYNTDLNVYLKTAGTIKGTAKQGVAVDAITPDLGAE